MTQPVDSLPLPFPVTMATNNGNNVMLWCDKLSSTPTVGYLLDPHFAGNDVVLTSVAPILDEWSGKPALQPWGGLSKPEFQINQTSGTSFTINHDQGFDYSFEPTKLTVVFQHKMRHKFVSGSLPVAELISSPEKFSDLLNTSLDSLNTFATLLPNAKSRSIYRIGIVATTISAEEDLPPGLRKFVDYIQRPWNGNVGSFALTNLNAQLRDDEQYEDRCFHSISRGDTEERLLTLVFDWQRYFKKPIPIERPEMEKAGRRARDAAFEYFEQLAVGDAFDG